MRRIEPLRVLVTDSHDRSALGVLRSVGRAGHRVTAAFPENEMPPASTSSRYCSSSLRHPDAWQRRAAFEDWLLQHVVGGRFDVIWPTSEASLSACRSVRSRFPDGCLAVMASDATLDITLSKFHSTRVARSLGILCPPTVFVSDGSGDGDQGIDLTGLRSPIVIKTDNHLSADGAYVKGHRIIVGEQDEALRHLRGLMPTPTRIIAQEWTPGHGVGACLLRFGGETHLRFTYRRLHEIPYSGGHSALRESTRDDELTDVGRALLDAIGFEGIAMIEFRRGPDGRPYFLEINGRPWGSLALALHAGVDFPNALLECYRLGRPTRRQPDYRPGLRCRNVFRGELLYLSSIPRPSKRAAVIEFFLLSLDPTIRHDYFWWSDPLPGLAQAAKAIRTSARRFVGTRARRFRGGLRRRRLRARHRKRGRSATYFRRPLAHILFLCAGNICRSPFAERYWNERTCQGSTQVAVASSAGLHQIEGRPTPSRIARLAFDFGIDLSTHRSHILTATDVESVDAIFVMHDEDYRELVARFPRAKEKTYHLGLFADDGGIDIGDPYNQNEDDARRTLQRLVRSIDGLVKLA